MIKRLYSPKIACSCCRTNMRRIQLIDNTFMFECPSCNWKTISFIKGFVPKQSDIDKIRLVEKTQKPKLWQSLKRVEF